MLNCIITWCAFITHCVCVYLLYLQTPAVAFWCRWNADCPSAVSVSSWYAGERSVQCRRQDGCQPGKTRASARIKRYCGVQPFLTLVAKEKLNAWTMLRAYLYSFTHKPRCSRSDRPVSCNANHFCWVSDLLLTSFEPWYMCTSVRVTHCRVCVSQFSAAVGNKWQLLFCGIIRYTEFCLSLILVLTLSLVTEKLSEVMLYLSST